MFAEKILLLNEDDLTISPEDIAKIKGTDSIEGTDLNTNPEEDSEGDPNLDNQDPNDQSNMDDETPPEEDPNNPDGGMDDPASMDSTNSTKLTVKEDDNSKKVKLLDLYKDLIDVTEDQLKAVEALPFINELEFLETVAFIKSSLSEIKEDLNYIIKYQYLNLSYLTGKKIFLNFKFTLIEITRLLKTIFIYCKNNENIALDEAIKKRRNIKSNSLKNAITFYQRNAGKRSNKQN